MDSIYNDFFIMDNEILYYGFWIVILLIIIATIYITVKVLKNDNR